MPLGINGLAPTGAPTAKMLEAFAYVKWCVVATYAFAALRLLADDPFGALNDTFGGWLWAHVRGGGQALLAMLVHKSRRLRRAQILRKHVASGPSPDDVDTNWAKPGRLERTSDWFESVPRLMDHGPTLVGIRMSWANLVCLGLAPFAGSSRDTNQG